jgi:hypothetical protein
LGITLTQAASLASTSFWAIFHPSFSDPAVEITTKVFMVFPLPGAIIFGSSPKFDGFVKSPSAALRYILRRCGVPTSTPCIKKESYP